jgi:hypothetical protein
MVSIRNNQFKTRNGNGDVIKICKYKIKKIRVIYSKVILLKSKITCDVSSNITSNFGVVVRVSSEKAINPIVTSDIKIPKEDYTETLSM